MNASLTSLIDQRLAEIRQTGVWRTLHALRADGAYVTDCADGRRMLNFSGNDYLGLAATHRPNFSTEQWAHGSTSSALLTGYPEISLQLEEAIARSYGTEAALLFNSGYHMNTGIVPVLADAHTLIVADRLIHASMIDGIRLSGVPFERFRHNDYNHLESILRRKAADYPLIILMVESLYSMDGDTADLKTLVEIKNKYPQVMLYVDEAHAIGVRGKNGLGLAEETGTISSIDLLCGTFGKALASMGGYVACCSTVRDLLVNRCRPVIFSTALPPIVTAYTLAVWQMLPGMQNERLILEQRSSRLRQYLTDMSVEMPSQSHIVPWLIGDNDRAVQTATQLQRLGFYALPIRPPTVPRGTARLRFSVTAATPVEGLIEAIGQINPPH